MQASLGGYGWLPRETSHHEELGPNYGVRSEVGALREVLLVRPPDRIAEIEDPSEWLMRQLPDLDAMRAEHEALVAFYEARGVTVRLLDRPEAVRLLDRPEAPPNIVFARDLFLMTREGAVMSRMASQQRAGEEPLVAAALAQLGVPILASPRGGTHFEGAGDALWRDEQTLLVGVGQRTNAHGVMLLAQLLVNLEIEVHPVFMPGGVSHLSGMLQFVDRDRAVIRYALSDDVLAEQLDYHKVEVIRMDENREVRLGGSLDFITLEPNVVLMPAGNPDTREAFELSGIEVHELPFEQHTRADGGIGSATAVLRRED